MPEVLQARRDLELSEVPLLLEEAEAVVVLLTLHPRAGVVPQVGVVQVRTIGASQSLPAVENYNQSDWEEITKPMDCLHNV